MTTTVVPSFSPPPRFVLAEVAQLSLTPPSQGIELVAEMTGKLSKHAIYIVVQGGGMLYAGNKSFLLFAGSCQLVPSGMEVRMSVDGPEVIGLFRLLYDTEGAENLAETAEELMLDNLPLLRGRLERLMAAEGAEGPRQLEQHILFQQIMLLLWKGKRGNDERDWTAEGLKEQWADEEHQEAEQAVEKTIAYLHSSYRDPIQIGKLAQDAHMSRWQYGSLFKSLTGRTPMGYLTALRISLSRQLLADESAPRLREIAGRVGFQHRAAAWRDRLRGAIGQGETASAFVVHHGLYVYSDHHFGHTLYRGLGYAAPESVSRMMEREPGTKWKRISPEQMADYAGDRIFMALPSAGPDAVEAQELLNTPSWRNLPAVQAGRVHFMDLTLANYNPLTLDAHLNAVGEQLLEKSSKIHFT